MDNKVKLAITLLIAIVSFLILLIFKPFGLHVVKDTTYFVGFGFNAFIAILCHYFIAPMVFPRLFDSQHWTVGKEYLFYISIILGISTLNYLYNGSIGADFSPQYGFWHFIFMTSAVGALPVLIMLYLTERVASAKNEKEAGVTYRKIENSNRVGATEKEKDIFITIASNNKTERPLTIPMTHFLFAKSSGNYIEVFSLNEQEQLIKKLLRLTLAQLASQLSNHDVFVRCHKSYLVNKRQITDVKGNARSCVAIIRDGLMEIPLSRTINRQNLL